MSRQRRQQNPLPCPSAESATRFIMIHTGKSGAPFLLCEAEKLCICMMWRPAYCLNGWRACCWILALESVAILILHCMPGMYCIYRERTTSAHRASHTARRYIRWRNDAMDVAQLRMQIRPSKRVCLVRMATHDYNNRLI